MNVPEGEEKDRLKRRKPEGTLLMARRLLSLALLSAFTLTAQTAGSAPYFFLNATFFSAEGTWIPVDPKTHAAFQTETELDCARKSGMCIEATADYYSGHPHISLTYFPIAKWDSNGILASNDDEICASRTVTIGFATKHIVDTREAKLLSKEKQKACATLGVPESESWTLALKDSKIWAHERDRQHMD